MKKEELEQLDDSEVEDVVEEGEYTEDEAMGEAIDLNLMQQLNILGSAFNLNTNETIFYLLKIADVLANDQQLSDLVLLAAKGMDGVLTQEELDNFALSVSSNESMQNEEPEMLNNLEEKQEDITNMVDDAQNQVQEEIEEDQEEEIEEDQEEEKENPKLAKVEVISIAKKTKDNQDKMPYGNSWLSEVRKRI